ncbi:MAG: DNA-binding response regulator [Proteobacteria bacterium]|jgi:two-component system phosphate regulon response regulator PhoB|nr:DNA-binding response regulator [Pseudomonadota bacterium]
MPETILVIEDEEDVADLVRYHLRKAKYRVVISADGADGAKLAVSEKPDAIVLDVMLPKLNGFEVTKRLRSDARTAGIPILILSAKGETENRIKGLEFGADDYLPKPFSPKELLLRIQALLRRKSAPTPESVDTGPFSLDRTSLKVTLDGQRVDLTSTEFKLLSLLIGKAGSIQSREDLLQEVWGYRNTVDTRTVDTHMRRLREKLGDHASCIETIRGEGYRFIPPSHSA